MIDGVGPVRRLFDIVIPAFTEIIAINLVLTTILTFNYFDMIGVVSILLLALVIPIYFLVQARSQRQAS
jgi:ABC-type sugar transport system permease subunit